jgi:hypothetical protein
MRTFTCRSVFLYASRAVFLPVLNNPLTPERVHQPQPFWQTLLQSLVLVKIGKIERKELKQKMTQSQLSQTEIEKNLTKVCLDR